jgi:hypothetical protein
MPRYTVVTHRLARLNETLVIDAPRHLTRRAIVAMLRGETDTPDDVFVTVVDVDDNEDDGREVASITEVVP